MLSPIIALIAWTLIVWVWMYATRLPAIRAAGIDPNAHIHPGALDQLPAPVRVVADNYNHLHEQPTVFYALAFAAHLSGAADSVNTALAWAYVVLRIVHSFAQIVLKNVVIRFLVFALSTLMLIIITVRTTIVVAG